MANLSNILQQFLRQYRQTRATQIGEKKAGLATLQRAADLFGPGYGADVEKRALASAQQSAVSAGLSGTTVPGARAAGISAEFETQRRSRLASALSNIAQYQAQVQPVTPTPGVIASTAATVGQQRLAEQKFEEEKRAQRRSRRFDSRIRPGRGRIGSGAGTMVPSAVATGGFGTLSYKPAGARVRFGGVAR
jgi:hypothetical protein